MMVKKIVLMDLMRVSTLRCLIRGYTRLFILKKISTLPALIWTYPFIKSLKIFHPTHLLCLPTFRSPTCPFIHFYNFSKYSCFFLNFFRLFLNFSDFSRVLVCERACVRHTRACGNLGAKEVRSFMELCVRMCVRAWFGGCVTRVRSHLKFLNKMMKKRPKTKVFLC